MQCNAPFGPIPPGGSGSYSGTGSQEGSQPTTARDLVSLNTPFFSASISVPGNDSILISKETTFEQCKSKVYNCNVVLLLLAVVAAVLIWGKSK
jgi:hypothetical protein